MQERAPGVLLWYRVYCGIMVLLYGLVAVLGVMLPSWIPEQDMQEAEISSGMLVLIGIALGAVFLCSFLLPRTSWAWVVHIILICLGLTSCLFWPICIPLLIFWVKPEAKAWFGYEK